MHIRAVESLGVLQLPAAATVLRKALAERNSGVRKVSYGGHGARSPRTSSEGRAVPYHPDCRHSARCRTAHQSALVGTGTLGPPE